MPERADVVVRPLHSVAIPDRQRSPRNRHLPTSIVQPFFKRALFRFGCLPASEANALVVSPTAAALAELAAVRLRAQRSRDLVSGLLHSAVGRAVDPVSRRSLLRLRRDLHSGRAVPATQLEDCLSFLSAEHASIVSAVAADLRRASELSRRVRVQADADLDTQRQALLELARRPDVRTGILLSSADLDTTLDKLIREGITSSAKSGQILRGVLRYVTRAGFKATPFATFCRLAFSRLVVAEPGATSDLAQVRFDSSEESCLIRLNKLHLSVLWESCKAHREIALSLRLEVNPTAARDSTHWACLSSYNGCEVVQRLTANEAVDAVMAEAARLVRPTFQQLVATLSSHDAVEATPDEAQAFLVGLISSGFLRFQAPVSLQDADWADTLADVLQKTDTTAGRATAEHLRSAAESCRTLLDGDLLAQKKRLTAARESLSCAAATLASGGRLLHPITLYVDRGIRTPGESCLSPRLTSAFAVLEDLVTRLAQCAHPRHHMLGMRHYFDGRYGAEARVALLDFYRDFFRDHLKEWMHQHEQRQRGGGDHSYSLGNPFHLKAVDDLFATTAKWNARLIEAIRASPSADEVQVQLDDLVPIHELPARTWSSPLSTNLFVQWHEAHEALPPRVVAPGVQAFLGFGKYFSRFLDLFVPDVTNDLRVANSGHQAILAEIEADSNFNANLHPALFNAGIAYPTGDAQPSANGVPVTTLWVERDPLDADAIRLVNADGGMVVPIDLGFLNATMRPALFQLLLRFSPFGAISLNAPTFPAVGGAQSPNERNVIYRPRIVVNDSLVIARRGWYVRGEHFPQLLAGESIGEYLIRLDEWRTSFGLPDEGYVRIIPRPQVAPVGTGAAPPAKAEEVDHGARVDDGELPADPEGSVEEHHSNGGKRTDVGRPGRSRDIRKPQFIAFRSPILADLLGRLATNVPAYDVLVEEVYPPRSAWLTVDGEQYAFESVVQIDHKSS